MEFLTEEQEVLYESLGGELIRKRLMNLYIMIKLILKYQKKLREQGVTKYLCENEDYLDEIRNGSIICEGINVEEIKKMLLG